MFVAPGRFGHAITGTMRRAPSARGAYPLETNLVAHFARCLRRGDTQWGRVRIALLVAPDVNDDPRNAVEAPSGLPIPRGSTGGLMTRALDAAASSAVMK